MQIREAREECDIEKVRELWTQYWEGLGLALTFQGFGDQLRRLPGEFAAPSGILLLATDDSGKAAGTVAVRSLEPPACEAKRLFVRPQYRGSGLGRQLLLHAIEAARAKGYLSIYGDTLPSMQTAARMYAAIGFEQVGPYSKDPTPGAIYLRLRLHGSP